MRERLVVVWRVTTRCNLACPFCACDRTLTRSRPEADSGLIARTGSSLARWSERTGRPVLVSWLGGEPLRWPQLTELSERFHRLGLQLSTTTNGTPLVNPNLRRLLVERFAELTVSVDGFAGTHDTLRGRRGLFDEMRGHVNRLATEIADAGSSLVLRANVVLMRRTISEFPRLCRELTSWGIREITCNQLGGADRTEFFPANRLLPEQIDQLHEDWPGLQAELAADGVRLLGGAAYLQRMAASSRGERLDVMECGPGRRFLFIDEAGRVAPCSFTGDEYGIPIENIESADAWENLPERFSEARRCHRSSRCSDCHSTQVFNKFA